MNLGISGWRRNKLKGMRELLRILKDVKMSRQLAADTKAGESFKTSMRMAFAKQTHNSMVGFAIPNAAKAKSVNGSETDW